MGMQDTVIVTCFWCKTEIHPQTKILGANMLEVFRIGNEVCEEFSDCILNLKEKCHKCGKETAIVIKNGKIVGVEDPKFANCTEGHWGQYVWEDDLTRIVKEKLRTIELRGGKK